MVQTHYQLGHGVRSALVVDLNVLESFNPLLVSPIDFLWFNGPQITLPPEFESRRGHI